MRAPKGPPGDAGSLGRWVVPPPRSVGCVVPLTSTAIGPRGASVDDALWSRLDRLVKHAADAWSPAAAWYTRAVLDQTRRSADCSRKARRSSREAGESLRQASAPERCRRIAGDMYPSPSLRAQGLFSSPARDALMPATVIVGLQWGDEGKGK